MASQPHLIQTFFLVFTLHGVSGDRLMMKPDRHTHRVLEGTEVRLSCYAMDGSDISPVQWRRDGWFICMTNYSAMNTCNITTVNKKPSDRGGQTNCDCDISNSVLTITNVSLNDNKNWSCTSGQQKKVIQLLVETHEDMNTASVHNNTLSTTSEAAASASSTLPYPSSVLTVTSSKYSTQSSLSPTASTSSTPGSVTASSVVIADDGEIHILVGAVIGCLVLSSVVVSVAVVAFKKRSARSAAKENIRLARGEPSAPADEIVMENSLYSSNSSPALDEIGMDVYSVVKKGDNSTECTVIYAIPDKTKTVGDPQGTRI